jgi:transposase
VPADNNLAEREPRPLVIASKIGFGSRSDSGARTREILMTALHTLKKRTTDVASAFKTALDRLAEAGDIEPYKAVLSFDSS